MHTDPMTGHVFVVQGNALQIACDELLVPTDDRGTVSPFWKGLTTPLLPRGWKTGSVRVSDSVIRRRHRVRWVNTGSLPKLAQKQRLWLRDGVREAMTTAAKSLEKRPPKYGRSRPLIAAPIFGTGAGGFSGIRGAVIKDLLQVSRGVVARYEVDIVLVAHSRSDYAALQAQRQDADFSALSSKLRREAEKLGREMARGQVAFFIGAGLSLPAGLPSWKELIKQLAQGTKGYSGKIAELGDLAAPDAALLLSKAPEFRKHLKAALGSPVHAIGHALVASMRPAEVITTNFDTLYEQAAQWTYTKKLVVIPAQRGAARAPWLLKLHGDIDAKHIVLNRDEFLGYDHLWRPLAGMLQATMLTRHLVFVGYSLEDENFVRLGRSVSALLRSMNHRKPVGTVLTPESKPLRSELWGEDLTELPTVVKGQDSFRIFEVFLDRMAASAAAGESSYLLDQAYTDLLSRPEKALAKALRDTGGKLQKGSGKDAKWVALHQAFASLGLKRPTK